MAKPRRRDVSAAKRLARYLVTRMRMVCHFKKQERPNFMEGWSDSDWAGCLETRKSTSGGILKFGKDILKAWSTTQNTIALSSGEAEYYALVKASSIARTRNEINARRLWNKGGSDMRNRCNGGKRNGTEERTWDSHTC